MSDLPAPMEIQICTPDNLRAVLARRRAEYHDPKSPVLAPISAGLKGALIGKLNGVLHPYSHLINGDDSRHLLLGYLFGEGGRILRKMRSAELQEDQWYALNKWIGALEFQGDWLTRWGFPVECLWAMERAGQLFGVQLSLIQGGLAPSLGELIALLPYAVPPVLKLRPTSGPAMLYRDLLIQYPLPDGRAGAEQALQNKPAGSHE